jgi:predicted transcriptional regulator
MATTRFTIEFPEEANAVLEELARKEHLSKREVIRRALAFYNYIRQQGVDGTEKKVSITDKDDHILKDILM